MNGPPILSVTAIRSRSREPTTFCAFTTVPSRGGRTQTRTFGTPSTVIMQFGHWPEQQSSPRRRWYLKLRPNTRRPAAKSAEPIVSPANARTGSPSNVNVTVFERSISSCSRGGSLTPAAPS